jgi:hypothetical protein
MSLPKWLPQCSLPNKQLPKVPFRIFTGTPPLKET